MRGARWPVTWGVGAVIVGVSAAVLGAASLVTSPQYRAEQGRHQTRLATLETKRRATIAESARPLLAALQQYRHEHGNYPSEWQALVPAFLPLWPKTGDAECPHFGYWLMPYPYKSSEPFPFFLYASCKEPETLKWYAYSPRVSAVPDAAAELPSLAADWTPEYEDD